MAQPRKLDGPSIEPVLPEHKIKVDVMNLYVSYADMSGKQRGEMLNFAGKARANGSDDLVVGTTVVNAVSFGELVNSRIAYVSSGKSTETMTASLHLKREDFDLVKTPVTLASQRGQSWIAGVLAMDPRTLVRGVSADQPVVKLQIAVGMKLG